MVRVSLINNKNEKYIVDFEKKDKTKIISLFAWLKLNASNMTEININEDIYAQRPDTIRRPMIRWLSTNYYINKDIKLKGVEIGCCEGKNSISILENLNMDKLYIIDPFQPYEEDNIIYKRNLDYSKQKEIMIENISPYIDKVEFLNMTSMEAFKYIPNNLDFVYIDGNHEYSFVINDIEMYWTKLAKYGVLGGHDFSPVTPGVPKAVLQFQEKYKLIGNFKKNSEESDWWFIKER